MIKIPVKITALEKRRRSVGLMHMVSGLFLLANTSALYKALAQNELWLVAVFYLVAASAFLYGLFRKKWDAAGRFNATARWVQAVTFLVLAMLWVQAGNAPKSIGPFAWAALSVLLALTEGIALQPLELVFAADGISYPKSYNRKHLPWRSLENVVVRPDFLTLYFPQDRFLQFELKEAISPAAMAALQDFCRRHLPVQAPAVND